ncbi:MAG: bifunctional riboflavin kinase/FAD synthetase [Chloroflexi bacterium]|nr:bifunctional riboflavin kinase/FAD synthetase [Chloroflexota bacterium]MDA1002456.1 bifunctional riboflavin kinase/FAD synthetase [Chloroflexota bacterium]
MLLVREELRRSETAGEHALSIGVFDGVHEGHRMLVRRLIAEAQARGLGTGIITFHPHPITVVRPDVSFSYLDSLERRVELLRELGIDFVSVLQFTSELQQVSAYDFVRLLVEEAGLRLLVVGDDFHLGRGREGDTERLREFGQDLGFEVIALPLLQSDADRVSSTRVRNALAAGEMGEVATLLGRPFALRGPVLHGDERGRKLNFPTLNIGVAADRALPPNGVYVTRAHVAGGDYNAVTNIGTQPTFDGATRRVETHLLDFEGDLYGQVASIDLLHRIREERKFAGVDELVAQMKRDLQTTREWFA